MILRDLKLPFSSLKRAREGRVKNQGSVPASRSLIFPQGLLWGSWYELKAQGAAVLLAHCLLFVRRSLVKNTNSDTSPWSPPSWRGNRQHLFSHQRRPFNLTQVSVSEPCLVLMHTKDVLDIRIQKSQFWLKLLKLGNLGNVYLFIFILYHLHVSLCRWLNGVWVKT